MLSNGDAHLRGYRSWHKAEWGRQGAGGRGKGGRRGAKRRKFRWNSYSALEINVCCSPGIAICSLKGKRVLDEAQLRGIYGQVFVISISLFKFYLPFYF